MSSFPFNNFLNLPLSDTPYMSRVESFEITPSTSKNYGMVAFKPGFALQASELNEIQDITLLNISLTSTMFQFWQRANATEQYYPPGWLGTTPLWPDTSLNTSDPYGVYPTSNLFQATRTTGTLDQYTFTAKTGWYHAYIPKSGLKHWVHLNQNLTINTTLTSSVYYIGFSLSYSEINSTQDSSLLDNSSGMVPTGTAIGANRIKINIGQPQLVATTNLNIDQFSPIARISTIFEPNIQYMNKRPVPIV